MGLKDIQLTNGQIADLYGSHLTITEQQVIKKEITTASEKSPGFAGKNKKQFVWVVNEPDFPLLPDEDFVFLGEILAACKMNMDDIILLNHAKNNMGFDEIIERFSPQIIISSNAPGLQLPFPANEYIPAKQNEMQLFVTQSLSIIRQDRSIKGKLWLGLKQMLGL